MEYPAREDGALLQIVDSAMGEAVERGGDWIACRAGCAECCLGPFEITVLDGLRLQAGWRALRERDGARAERVRRRAAEYVEGPDAACPALDPETKSCDLYGARPVLCRVFGPAVWGEAGVQACELCFEGAEAETVQECAVEVDDGGLEEELVERCGGGRTSVAEALGALPLE